MTISTPDSWRQILPPVIDTDSPAHVEIPVHVPHGTTVRLVVADAEGNETDLQQVDDHTPPQEVDGVLTGQASFALIDLGPGEYSLRAFLEDGSVEVSQIHVRELAAENPVGLGRPEYDGRNWGISVVPYAIRSEKSWGIGDLADLTDLAVMVARAGGDYLILTPIVQHIGQAVADLGLSTDKSGTLIIDPIYIRPEDIRETAYLPSAQRTMLDWSSEGVRATNYLADPIDFADIRENKRAALEVIFSGQRSAMRQGAFEQFQIERGEALAPYIHAAVAAETQNPQELFAELQTDSTAGSLARKESAERIEFHLWLQWVAGRQLENAQREARNAGMKIGLLHTLAASVGSAAVSELARYGGGIYLADAQNAESIITAAREAGLVAISDGREPANRELLAEAGVTPQTTLRAEFSGEGAGAGDLSAPLMIAVALDDDPPTAGALAEEHLSLMKRLGILEESYEQRRKEERIMRERILEALQTAELLPQNATERQIVEGLYAYLTRSSAHFLTVTLSDAVGNRRPFTLGGAYPDWSYPYTDGAGASVLVEGLADNARFESLLERIDSGLRIA